MADAGYPVPHQRGSRVQVSYLVHHPHQNPPPNLSLVPYKFPQERMKDFVKIWSYGAFWAGRAFPSLPANVQVFSLEMGHIKNLLSAIEIPRRAQGLWKESNVL